MTLAPRPCKARPAGTRAPDDGRESPTMPQGVSSRRSAHALRKSQVVDRRPMHAAGQWGSVAGVNRAGVVTESCPRAA